MFLRFCTLIALLFSACNIFSMEENLATKLNDLHISAPETITLIGNDDEKIIVPENIARLSRTIVDMIGDAKRYNLFHGSIKFDTINGATLTSLMNALKTLDYDFGLATRNILKTDYWDHRPFSLWLHRIKPQNYSDVINAATFLDLPLVAKMIERFELKQSLKNHRLRDVKRLITQFTIADDQELQNLKKFILDRIIVDRSFSSDDEPTKQENNYSAEIKNHEIIITHQNKVIKIITPQLVSEQIYAPVISPNGRYLAYRQKDKFYIINLKNEQCIRIFDCNDKNMHGAWSPDSKWFAFRFVKHVGRFFYSNEIRINNIETVEYKTINSQAGSRDLQPIMFTPNGKYIIEICCNDYGKTTIIKITDLIKNQLLKSITVALENNFLLSTDGMKLINKDYGMFEVFNIGIIFQINEYFDSGIASLEEIALLKNIMLAEDQSTKHVLNSAEQLIYNNIGNGNQVFGNEIRAILNRYVIPYQAKNKIENLIAYWVN